MKAQLALCMKYMPAACMKSLTLTHEGWEFGFAKFQFSEFSELPKWVFIGATLPGSSARFPGEVGIHGLQDIHLIRRDDFPEFPIVHTYGSF